MKRLLVLLSFAVSLLTAMASVNEQWIRTNYSKTEHRIPMRDSVRLHTIIYAPNDTLHHPILLTRCTYGAGPYGPDSYDQALWKLLEPFTSRGYIIVKQDLRGLRMSEGTFMHIRPVVQTGDSMTNELTDTYDTAEWLLANTNNNGCIGVSGHSYLGFTTLLAGMSGHPAIKAISPQAPIGDWFMGDDFHHNGAFMPSHAFSFFSRHGLQRHGLSTNAPKRPRYINGNKDDFFRQHRVIADLSKLFGDSIQFWNDMISHPDYDTFWQDRSHLLHIDTIPAAVLLTGGWYDSEDLYGTLATYDAITSRSPGTPCHLIMGPWGHGSWRRDFKGLGDISFGQYDTTERFKSIWVAFFEHYLRGVNMPLPDGATCFSSGDNSWHTLPHWPPASTTKLTLYPGDNGRLSTVIPESVSSFTTYLSDPANPVPYSAGNSDYMIEDQRFTASRPDVLTFVTPPLDSAVTVAGSIIPTIWMSSTTDDADIVVKLIDVYPDDQQNGNLSGYRQLVRGDIMPAHYRNGFDHRTPLVPGEAVPVTVPMPDIFHTFMPGHRIMIQIQSSWFPLFRMSPQQCIDEYRCDNDAFIPAYITVYHDSSRPTSITLPVIMPAGK